MYAPLVCNAQGTAVQRLQLTACSWSLATGLRAGHRRLPRSDQVLPGAGAAAAEWHWPHPPPGNCWMLSRAAVIQQGCWETLSSELTEKEQ